MTYLPRDFIETAEGLVFAVVDACPEAGRVLCFLRYAPVEGRLRKLGTDAANACLEAQAPDYLFHSARLDARLHGVPVAKVCRHHRPRARAASLRAAGPQDAMEAKLIRLLEIFAARGLDLDQFGVTGSLLLGAHTAASDLDLVIYGREAFFQAREAVRAASIAGELAEPDAAAWQEAYGRRGCALDFAEYRWHERRKHNKGLIEGSKFDITLIGEELPLDPGPVRKLGATVVQAEVIDAQYAYDCPALYRLRHPELTEALSFTQTYAGQAEAGEMVEIAGLLEQTAQGRLRIVVGGSREAPGQYIKVVRGGKARSA
jgi:predicted nucleotidyltransferase